MLHSSKRKLLNKKESVKSRQARGREIQRATSLARVIMKSSSRSSIKNKTIKSTVKSKIIQPNFSIIHYLESLSEMAKSRVWSDRYEVCSKLIQIIKDQYTILQKDKCKDYFD